MTCPCRGRAVIGAAAVLAPGAALAHAAERMVILSLPTGHYLVGAALAIVLTVLLGVAAGTSAGTATQRLPAAASRRLYARRRLSVAPVGSWVACALLWALVATGVWGSRDPLLNPLVIAVWTGLWIALPLATLVLGNFWGGLDPWSGPVRAARRLLGRTGSLGLRRLGHWPAVVGFFGFAWFEIVSVAPADPAVLASAVALYWLIVFGIAVLDGERWLETGEAFGVYLRFLAQIAPVWRRLGPDRVEVRVGWPGGQILSMAPLPPSAVAFVTLVIAAVSFDGLSETFWWLARIGVNPLEFPGRSAVVGVNSAGLIAAWLATAAAVLGTIALGHRLAGARGPLTQEIGWFALSFLPISAGFHAAHYLVALLTQGQYAVVVLDDPLGRHWNLLGLPRNWVSFAFLTDPGTVRVIWNLQFALILGAHLLAIGLTLRIAALRWGSGRPVAHLPMTALMVVYTVFGLWLLSTATGA